MKQSLSVPWFNGTKTPKRGVDIPKVLQSSATTQLCPLASRHGYYGKHQHLAASSLAIWGKGQSGGL